ncbi:MFS transporter [Actinokineospora iranica]|uniref:Major facilitator superfamily (MFS) profile domain-containing protein n=1 Tax=Actinokineospora iranica TaxID=1271860 RepID=A0A1G6KRI4_9PSEU|nr:hypothetical protein [Actinokineospora iranica]SDC33699.1 hypothetical protein SAMN05216174_1011063 [Actinokineospora iranica]
MAAFVTTGVEPELAGLASGLLNTARHIGAAVGLAALTTIADTATTGGHPDALVHGHNTALTATAGVAVVAAMLAFLAPSTSGNHR